MTRRRAPWRLGPELTDLVARLAAAVGLGPPVAVAAVDWPRWLELVHEHDLAPLLHARRARTGALPPAEVADALAADHMRWAHDTVFRCAELGTILATLGDDLPAVALKGSALAVTLYDQAAERRMSDLDLLVDGAAARDRAVARLAGLGYRVRHPDIDPASHDLALWGSVQELEIDVHINFTRPALPAAAMADAWSRRIATEALGGRLVVLDPVWRTLHAALHALSDPIGSPLLRNLLEVGWLAAGLDPGQRAALVERAARFGVAERAGRAFGLAHRLFGTPALVAVPRPSAWELWSWRRLSWRYRDDQPRQRLVQHVAEYHLRRLQRDGRHGLDPRPLLATALDAAAGIAAGAGRRWWHQIRPPRAAALRRVDGDTAVVGHHLVIHAEPSGDVHLLDDDAARAWRAADGDTSADQVVARLAGDGMPVDRAAAAVAALIERSLLDPG